ncbi:MAG TPA: DUF4229 domain-containing protein [Actinomycetales bacterium]|nr:DUF4229 domain-containing protein [Actinomycetales bacterium]
MSPLLKFSALRIALFVAALAVLYVIGARDWLLLFLAAFVSLALSYVLLRAPREELAASIEQRAQQRAANRERPRAPRKSAAERDAEVEDAAVDQELDQETGQEDR